MNNAQDRKKCAHVPCECAATADTNYCSVYCENAAGAADVEIACSCGHPGCEL